MTTSNYMPDVVVEVAFGSGYSTPAASRTWTDVSAYVELDNTIGITFGRQDQMALADANRLSLTLDNRDGRFTAQRTGSPYYPNVKLFTPIRVTATPVGGSASVRFLGYVTEWPTEWDGSDVTAYVKLKAVSRLARLGATTSLRSMLEQEVLLDTPLVYYTMADPDGSLVASESSGNGKPPLASTGSGTGIVFGNAVGPDTDGLSAATLATGGAYLRRVGVFGGASTPRAVECWFSLSALPAVGQVATLIQIVSTVTPTLALALVVDSSGTLTLTINGTSASAFTTVSLGDTHHVVGQYIPGSPGTVDIYLDGSHDSNTLATSTLLFADATLTVGGPGPGTTSQGFTVAHASIYGHALPEDRIVYHYQAGRATLLQEAAGVRLVRLASYSGVPDLEVSAAGALTLTGAQATTGKKLVDAMREVETTEGGVLYDARDNTLTLTGRAARYTAAVALTFDMSAQQVGDFTQPYDASYLRNDATVTGPSNSARFTNAASVTSYGPADDTSETLAVDPDEPLALAGWLVNNYGEPKVRVPSLAVDVINCGLSQNTIAGLTIGSLVSVSNQPGQAAVTAASYFVEGYTETFGPESWVMSLNVSDATPYLSTWVLDSGTRSQLDTSTVLAL